MAHVSKLYFEKYLVIELALGFVAIWEFYSVLLDELYDRSIIGYEIAGILIYFFSIEYNHVLLSHQMFDKLVTNVSAPTFFFDDSHNCIYMNPVGMEMFNIDKDDFEKPKKVILDFLEKNNKIDSDEFQIKIPIVKEDGEHIFQTTFGNALCSVGHGAQLSAQAYLAESDSLAVNDLVRKGRIQRHCDRKVSRRVVQLQAANYINIHIKPAEKVAQTLFQHSDYD